MIGLANYALPIIIDAPYLLEEGVDVDDFPVLVKIPIANAPHLFGTGETGDTIYFESEGVILKHELVEITATYLIAWIKLDLETTTKKVVTLHYGALIDNNYEDKRGVWVNAANVFHFNGNGTDTMGNNTIIESGTYEYHEKWGTHYKGLYVYNSNLAFALPFGGFTMPYTFIIISRFYPTSSYSINFGSSDTYFSVGNIGAGAGLFQLYTSPSGNSVSFNPGQTAPYNNTQHIYYAKYLTGNNMDVYWNGNVLTTTTAPAISFGSTIGDSFRTSSNFLYLAGTTTFIAISEMMLFVDRKTPEWLKAFYRMYNNPNAYIEYYDEVDLDALTDFTDEEVCCIANIVRQLEIYDYDFKKMVYEVGDRNAYWRPPGSEGIYVWGKLEMRPLYGEDVSFVDNLYANDAYFYTFTDYTYDVHDKLVIEGVIYDIQAIQVHDAGRETIYKTLVLKRQPEYYACCTGTVS